MLPTPSGSVIVGERVASLKDVKSSNTYIVISNTDGVVYKRIITNDDRSMIFIGEKLTLLSDNPLYEPYQVNTKDIVEVWKAVYIIHKAGCTANVECGSTSWCGEYITGSDHVYSKEIGLTRIKPFCLILNKKLFVLFPLNGCRWLTTNIIYNSVDASNLVDDGVAHMC